MIPLVSVVIRTYNREPLLKKAIESVRAQTFKDFELIIVDDGSQDATQQTIQEYERADPRIHGIVDRVKRGLVGTLEKGIQEAKGKYIAILDDDDSWFDPHKLDKQVAFLEQHPDYMAVGGGIIRVDGNGKELARHMPPESDEGIRRSILRSNPIAHSTSLFRKEAWERIGGYNQSLGFSEDWDLWMRLAKIGKLHNLQEYVASYLVGKQNRSRTYMIRAACINLRLRIKYRRDFPGFFSSFLFGVFALILAYISFPFR